MKTKELLTDIVLSLKDKRKKVEDKIWLNESKTINCSSVTRTRYILINKELRGIVRGYNESIYYINEVIKKLGDEDE